MMSASLTPVSKGDRLFLENFMKLLFEPEACAVDGELQARIDLIVDALHKRYSGEMTDAEVAELEAQLKALRSECSDPTSSHQLIKEN